MPKAMRLQFTVEKKENVRKVLDLYRAVFLENQAQENQIWNLQEDILRGE